MTNYILYKEKKFHRTIKYSVGTNWYFSDKYFHSEAEIGYMVCNSDISKSLIFYSSNERLRILDHYSYDIFLAEYLLREILKESFRMKLYKNG